MGKGVGECEKDCISKSAFCIGQRTGIKVSQLQSGVEPKEPRGARVPRG
jgi:hypothetical protein